MRGRATLVVVAGIAAVVIAAAVDAVRGGGRAGAPKPDRPPPVTAPASPADDLAAEGITGVLYVTVPSGAACQYRAISLPTLREIASAGPLRRCAFAISPDGRHIAEARPCPGGSSSIHQLINQLLSGTFIGCAPAWKPDGTFTYVSRGSLVAARDLDCLGAVGCLRTLVSRAVLERGLAVFGSRARARSVLQTAWLTRSRVAVLVRVADARASVAIFEGTARAASVDSAFTPATELEVVRGGAEFLVGFGVFNREGGFVEADRVPFPDAAAVAESPDGRWLAIARPGNVCIYPEHEAQFPVGCVPVEADDLAWR